MKRIVLVTGGFDPLHSGHIEYFKAAKKLGDKLVVGLNSDQWLKNKKGIPFMPFEERANIVKHLDMVDEVMLVEDDDIGGTTKAIGYLLQTNTGKIVVANGGDRVDGGIPEQKTYGDHPSVEFVFGVGGENKMNSSSWILDNWKTQKTERAWGYWRVLDDKQPHIGQKVKELVITPGSSLSDQKHWHRSEHWYVLEGNIQIELEYPNGYKDTKKLMPHDTFIIPRNTWHKTTNVGKTSAHIVEIQYGDACVETDIERRD